MTAGTSPRGLLYDGVVVPGTGENRMADLVQVLVEVALSKLRIVESGSVHRDQQLCGEIGKPGSFDSLAVRQPRSSTEKAENDRGSIFEVGSSSGHHGTALLAPCGET